MKKNVWFALTAALLFLSGCTGSTNTQTERTAQTALTQTEELLPSSASPSLRLCSSEEELAAAFSGREERQSELQFVNRGSCCAEPVAVAGDVAYILRDYGVELVSLRSTGAVKLSTLSVGYVWEETDSEAQWSGSEKQCTALLLYEERLVVLSDQYVYSIGSGEEGWQSRDSSRCTVDIYDISEPTAPKWMRSFSQTGSESGCLVSDGLLYLVTDREIYGDDTLCEATLPGWWQGESWTALPLSRVYLCEGGTASYLQLGIYELETASEPDGCALVGCGTEALLCERGLYALIPGEEGSAVYYLPVKEGSIAEPVASRLSESYGSVSELTGAGESLCLLRAGSTILEGRDWQRRFGENRLLTLTLRENTVELALFSLDEPTEPIAARMLGYDLHAAVEEDRAVFTDADSGLIGLPAEDGYTLYRWDGESFLHVLDCYSSDFSGNRRTILTADTLFVTDKKHVFTIDLQGERLISTLTF